MGEMKWDPWICMGMACDSIRIGCIANVTEPISAQSKSMMAGIFFIGLALGEGPGIATFRLFSGLEAESGLVFIGLRPA